LAARGKKVWKVSWGEIVVFERELVFILARPSLRWRLPGAGHSSRSFAGPLVEGVKINDTLNEIVLR
jgi:hypothetical protein